jgi:hypothetical protein
MTCHYSCPYDALILTLILGQSIFLICNEYLRWRARGICVMKITKRYSSIFGVISWCSFGLIGMVRMKIGSM